MKIIKKIALAVFKDKKVLLVRSHKQKEIFYTLGGKIEEVENDIECLKREVREEIDCDIDESSIKFLTQFEDVTRNVEKFILNIKVYEGKLIGVPKPSTEIVEVGYFDSKSNKKHLSEMAQKNIFPWLKKYGYLN